MISSLKTKCLNKNKMKIQCSFLSEINLVYDLFILDFFWNSWDDHSAMERVMNQISKDLILSLFCVTEETTKPSSLFQFPHLKEGISQT